MVRNILEARKTFMQEKFYDDVCYIFYFSRGYIRVLFHILITGNF